jgi:serine/threonine protein kinase/Tol biopolymer transport system component
MGIASGTKLGPYEIQSPLGAGGMGEVYRARDTRLERVVAVKVLPANLSSDPALRQRLEREAKAVSKLSHPHICTLHDIGHQDGVDFLVMELVEGETLEHRLIKGPLPAEQTIRFAAQIADALAKAHRMGITHRDLKPSNIMLTKGGAKLMDFGLAKECGTAPFADVLNELTVEQAKLTVEGTIIGTFQYMAPEQLEGKDADARTDIFALGELIYEMATGKPAFAASSRASLIAAILTSEPAPMTALHAMTPPALERVVKKCLAKDPDERWQSASDLAAELRWISESGSQAGVPAIVSAGRRSWDRAAWLVAALLLLTVIGGGAAWWLSAHPTQRAMYFNSPVPFPASDLALAPDGQFVAMVAYSEQAGRNMIWRHEVGSRQATTIAGTEDASHPFWSPDGRSVGFFAQGRLKKVDVFSGTSAQVLCEAPHGRGGTWNRDGVILFTPEVFTGLYRVSSAGGTPVEISRPDVSRFESSHRWPAFLPDQRHFLYTAANFSGRFEKNMIYVGALDSDEKRPIVGASSNVAYADPGYLLYWRDGALVAQRFDPRSYAVSGEPRTISDEVQYFPQTDLAVFDVAGKATLAVQTGKGAARSQLLWFDRSGKQVASVIAPPGEFSNPRLSPDGRRMAIDQTDSDGRHQNIWIHELANNSLTRLTFSPGLNQDPIWSPDGKRIVYTSSQAINFHIYEKNADGSGSEQEVADLGVPQQGPWDWSRDGKYLLVRKNEELWYMSLSDRQPKPFLQGPWVVRTADFSPDGKWVAYSSNETGNWEVYVSAFNNPSSKWQVSRGGGEEPRWRRDGRELFYLSGDGKMTAVAVGSGSNFEAGPPATLFQAHRRQPVSAMDFFSYDVTADGQRFLINTRLDEPNAAPLSIILNWASEMEK